MAEERAVISSLIDDSWISGRIWDKCMKPDTSVGTNKTVHFIVTVAFRLQPLAVCSNLSACFFETPL